MELLSPAGNAQKLYYAYAYGADAAYIGLKKFSLRAKADNFYEDDSEKVRSLKKIFPQKKLHCALNIIFHNKDIDSLLQNLDYFKAYPIDAFIVQDLGIIPILQKHFPDAALHLSTQASCINREAVKIYKSMGFSRIVLGREAGLKEIREIKDAVPDMELEAFVHGAMCISYSGRCLLSNYLTGRDANRGECTHPCRWKYSLMEETRPGEYFPVMENERGTLIFNSKDLCMIEHIPELIEAGIDSFKVEGRMKTALYVAAAARTYREAIDDQLKDPALYNRNLNRYLEEISKCTYRQFCTGFFFGKPSQEDQIYESSTYISEYTYLGLVSEVQDGRAVITQKNKFCTGDRIEIMKPDGRNIETAVNSIRNEEGEEMESAPHPGQKLFVKTDADCEPFDILRTPKTRT